MMTVCSAIARILVGIIALRAVSSLPPNRRERKYFFSSYEHFTEGECIIFDDHPCNHVFNRTESERYAKFPNSRGLTVSGAKTEFVDYFAILNAKPTGCYLALWSLLCFYYFPQCHPSLPLKYIVTPSRELCERTRRGCESFIEMSNQSWPEHMDCAKFNSSLDDNLCINGTADPDLVSKVNLITDPAVYTPTSQPPTTTTTTTAAPPATTETEITEPPSPSTSTVAPTTTTTHPTPPPNMPCPSRCNFRTRATGGTFKNNDYTFAANVTIINSDSTVDPRHTFLAVITRLWILDGQNCSRYENHSLVVIRSSYAHCPPCPDFNTTTLGDNVYLVAGYCNNRGWFLPPNDSLVSPWHRNPKYETKLAGWIQNGINHRGL